jgi:plasmid stabilization system protein ParE
MVVTWSLQSIQDVEAIRTFIAGDSPALADLVVRRVVDAVGHLQQFPSSGRIVPERQDPTIREVIVPPYRVIYRFEVDVVEIVTVFRSSRDFPSLTP